MHAFEFPVYANMINYYATNGKLCVGIEFNDREATIWAIKNYIISKSVDCNMDKSELRLFTVNANTMA